MLKMYSKFVTSHPWSVIALSLLLLIGASIGIARLSFKSDLRIYFSEDNPQIIALDSIESTYSKSDNVLFVIAHKDGAFSKDVLSAVGLITEKAWQIPFSRRVDSVTNFMHSSAQGDDIVVGGLAEDAETLTSAEINEIRKIALTDNLIAKRLVAADGKVTGVNVTVNIPKGKELSGVPQIAKAARSLAGEIQEKYPGIEVYLTGVVMMDTAFAEASEKDMKTLIPAMLTLALAIMGIIMRSWMASVMAMIALTFSIVGAMGLAGWFGILLNPVSINAPNIILTIAICNCVHLLMPYLSALRRGEEKDQAMMESLSVTFRPILLTTLSTCLGFLTLNFSDAPPFRDLGNLTFLGVLVNFLLTVTFLPALMMIVKTRMSEGQENIRMLSWMPGLVESIIAKPKQYFFGSSLLVVVLCGGIFNNVLNDEFVKYFDESVKFRQDTDFTSENLTGIYYIDYELRSKGESGVNDPDYLTQLDAFSEWLKNQDEVLHVNSIVDVYKKLNKNMHGDADAMYAVPATADLAAQYLLLYEMSLPYGLDLRDRVNASKDASRVTVTLNNLSSVRVLEFEERVQRWFTEHGSFIEAGEGTGLTVMFASIGQRNIVSMLKGTFIALVFISLFLIFAFRSLKYGALSLLPNVLPAAVAFGIWGIFVGQIGLALSVMSAMTLGIVVDDTIHLMTQYIRRRKEFNDDAADALRYAFAHVGPAIVTTTVALTLGFAMLGFSSFEINAGMGILTAIAIFIALVLDLVFLPAILLLVDGKRVYQTIGNESMPSHSKSKEPVITASIG